MLEIVPDSVEIIDDHLEGFIDSDDILVLHEIESEIIHSDIYIIKPNDDREYNLLLTCGLSALPMTVPENEEHLKFAELTMLLPKDWKLNQEDFEDENNYWPIRLLKQLSIFPHLNETWLAYGHTVPLDDSFKVDHNFNSVLIVESIRLHEDFTYIETEEKEIYIYSVIPIYIEEREYIIEYGTNKFLELFDKYDIDEIIDINRKNVCK